MASPISGGELVAQVAGITGWTNWREHPRLERSRALACHGQLARGRGGRLPRPPGSSMWAVDLDVLAAVGASHLRELPPTVLDDLFTGAVRAKIPAGSVAHRESDDAPYLELVISGVIRVFVAAPDGRTMTIRYCRPGELLGAMSLFSTSFSEPATKQALVDAELLNISPMRARQVAERDVRVARVFLVELSERARSFVHEIPGSAFASVRQRVARQLLDLASMRPSQLDGELAVQITQQDLAAAAGTVREVVVRTLRQLRESGAVRTERDRIIILDPARLTVEQGWNSSS